MANTTNERGGKYYKRGSIQVWDFIRDQELNFHLGNVIKYVCRVGYKDNDIEDLQKAIHYLENEVEFRTSQRVPRILPSDKLKDEGYSYDAEIFDR